MLVGGYAFSAASNNDFAIIRYNTDGSLDMSFDNIDQDGVVRTDLGGNLNDQINSIAIQEDGKIIAAGSTYNGVNYDYAVARYNLNGSLDNTFDSDGIIITDFNNSNDYGSTALIQPDRKIIACRLCIHRLQLSGLLVRYNADGSIDNTFGTTGKVVY